MKRDTEQKCNPQNLIRTDNKQKCNLPNLMKTDCEKKCLKFQKSFEINDYIRRRSRWK